MIFLLRFITIKVPLFISQEGKIISGHGAGRFAWTIFDPGIAALGVLDPFGGFKTSLPSKENTINNVTNVSVGTCLGGCGD